MQFDQKAMNKMGPVGFGYLRVASQILHYFVNQRAFLVAASLL
jgi:hypothetical protein